MSRLKERYQSEVVPAMIRQFGYGNVMEVPRITKVVVNVGVGEALDNAKALDFAIQDISTVTGQRPVITQARKSIATFAVCLRTRLTDVVIIRLASGSS
jgi:large subunit ribosomal protein L5